MIEHGLGQLVGVKSWIPGAKSTGRLSYNLCVYQRPTHTRILDMEDHPAPQTSTQIYTSLLNCATQTRIRRIPHPTPPAAHSPTPPLWRHPQTQRDPVFPARHRVWWCKVVKILFYNVVYGISGIGLIHVNQHPIPSIPCMTLLI